MKTLKFYIVDVFAIAKYTGNQLAVFTDASALSETRMQEIAKEINYSETTFITSSVVQNNGYNVRIFTPAKELPFAGHPTLGTACVIQQEIIKHPVETIHLNLQVGQIPVTWDHREDGDDILWMRQQSPTFHQVLNAADLASVLNLNVEEIDDRWPIQEVSTGVPFIIVPLKTLTSLRRIRVNRDKCLEFVANCHAKQILVFCPETHTPDNHLAVRVFADYLGVPEDPATGSANGCLAGYLVKYAYFGNQAIAIRVEQGYEMGRPSLLLLKAKAEGEAIEVSVGGKVVMVAKGEFL